MAADSLRKFLGNLGARPFLKPNEDGVFCVRENWDLVKDAPNARLIPAPEVGPTDVHWPLPAVELANAKLEAAGH